MVFMMCLLPVFWFHKVDGFRQFFFALSHLSERPHQIYRGWVGRTLVTIIPLGVMISVPTHMLFRGPNLADVAHIGLVTLGTFTALLLFWRWALRNYSSASS